MIPGTASAAVQDGGLADDIADHRSTVVPAEQPLQVFTLLLERHYG
jgi:hypothetical protein